MYWGFTACHGHSSFLLAVPGLPSFSTTPPLLLLLVSSRSWCHSICSSHKALSGSWWLVPPPPLASIASATRCVLPELGCLLWWANYHFKPKGYLGVGMLLSPQRWWMSTCLGTGACSWPRAGPKQCPVFLGCSSGNKLSFPFSFVWTITKF